MSTEMPCGHIGFMCRSEYVNSISTENSED